MQLQKIAISDLKPHPMNYNTHPENQLRELEKSLEQFDQFKNIVVCNNTIIAGHGLVEAAKRKGMTEIYALVRNDLTEDQQKALLVADNATPFLAIPDTEALEDLLKSIPDISFDDMPGMTHEWLESMDVSLDGLFDTSSSDEDDPAADEIPEVEEEPITKVGELWQLGRHRLLCGDATKREDVTLLLCGATPELSFTDPPYNMNYQDVAGNFKKIANDKMPDDDFIKFLSTSLIPLPKQSYICCNWMYYHLFKKAIENTGKEIKACIVWDKITRVQNLDKYFKQHEFILYTGKLGGEETLRGDVWQLQRQHSNLHPTVKPVELIETALLDNPKCKVVLDLFGGSGSTLIACEKLNRQCLMMELDPHYCTVIIRRWEQYTGQEATRIEQ